MPNITISDLTPAGSDLFSDSESYLHELKDVEINATRGGITPWLLVVAFTLIAFDAK
ncbi:hypothetical protein [Aphanothece sacrum]|uniref:Uncharacterized protein n=1 Tax=Aphanothece sacrum FPU1 TaxID=1920663 RepID=A0A401IHD6_APHSA|nr:hypothetical protein [Aphanothece sacrum]GBF80649.1 hypothetical protein AsFPU1_2053 [Aphanothece sacrum FPU1]GBF83143.1 hypothetical protein AsFPU3_0182 [Aphanothece sacrum FPU3]